MNREEISRIVSDVKGRICGDVRNELIKLVRSGKSLDTIANDLRMNITELRQIMNGATIMSFDVFVKLMVATGNAIEVRNIASLTKSMPPRKERRMETQHPHIKRPRMGMPPPPPFGMPIGSVPFKSECGVEPMVESSRPWERPNVNEIPTLSEIENSLHEKSSNELINMIYTNGWDNEINILGASRSDLITFLLSKLENPRLDIAMDNETAETFAPIGGECEFDVPQCEGMVADSEKERIAKGIAELVMNNPQLAEKLARFIPRA